MKIIGIIEARNDQTDCDRKAFVQLASKPALYHVAKRMVEAQLIDEVVLDACADAGNRPVLAIAAELHVRVRRTEEPDVLKRLRDTAILCGAEAVVVTNGRSPVLAPNLLDTTICHFMSTKTDLTTTMDPAACPTDACGVEIDVISLQGLETLMAYHQVHSGIRKFIQIARSSNAIRVSHFSQVPDIFLSIDVDGQLETLKEIFHTLFRAGAPIDLKGLSEEVDKVARRKGR